MRVKPADPTAVIRDPNTKQALPADGGDVPDNNFWRRRLQGGEVVLVDEGKPDADEGAEKPRGNEPLSPLTTRRGE